MDQTEIRIKSTGEGIEDALDSVGRLKEGINISIENKLTLTKEEASEYSNIGLNKLDDLMRDPGCPFVLYVGRKKLIKRKLFEKFIDETLEI